MTNPLSDTLHRLRAAAALHAADAAFRIRHLITDRPWMLAGSAVCAIMVAIAAVVVVRSLQRPPPPMETASPAAPPGVPVLTSSVPDSPAGFGEPLPSFPVISPFGLRQLPWEDRPRLHAGVDIVAPEGTPVLSVAPGMVVARGQDAGYGRYVRVQHGMGITSMYAHLGSVDPRITVGAALPRGGVIGQVGNSGDSTGAHLHFEMRTQGRRPLDPTFFIGRPFAAEAEWPLAAATQISPNIRMAVVSNIPESKRELMIARAEFLADELATQELAALAATEAANAELPPLDPAEQAQEAASLAGESASTERVEEKFEPAPAAAPEAAPAPPPPPAPPKPKRPAQPPRLPMPD